jgi:hypothetical protein
MLLIYNHLTNRAASRHLYGKSGMASYVAQPIESTPFRLTGAFALAYTRLTAQMSAAAPIYASGSPIYWCEL